MTQKLEKLDKSTFKKFETDIENKLEQIVWDLSKKYNLYETIVSKEVVRATSYLEDIILECLENEEELREQNFDSEKDELSKCNYQFDKALYDDEYSHTRIDNAQKNSVNFHNSLED